MKKSDLKTGMILELENGKESIVLLNTLQGDVTCDNSTDYSSNKTRLFNYYNIDNLDENLIGTWPQKTVIKIFNEYKILIWERKEEKTILTLDGIDYSESTLRSIIKKATN